MTNSIGAVSVRSGHVGIWAHDVNEGLKRATHDAVVRTLSYNRFVMRLDRDTLERHGKGAIGSDFCRDHHEGHNGDLHVRVHSYGRSTEVDFFVVPQYPQGTWERMGAYNQRRCIVHAFELAKAAVSLGYEFQDGRFHGNVGATLELRTIRNCMVRPRESLAALEKFNAGWTSKRFKRDASGWPCESEYNSCSRSRHPGVRAGDTVYAVEKGRLIRGTACPNMNDMWWMETGIGEIWPRQTMLLDPEIPTRPTRDQSNRRKRLVEELTKSIETKNYRRVARIATVLEREEPCPAQ